MTDDDSCENEYDELTHAKTDESERGFRRH